MIPIHARPTAVGWAAIVIIVGCACPLTAYGLDLYIPDKMLAGETYQGIVILHEPAIQDVTVYLSGTDPRTLDVPYMVHIAQNENHGIFDMETKSPGLAEVHASYGGDVAIAGGTIFSRSSQPQSIDLILPGDRTAASDLTGIILLLDGNDRPSPARSDTQIRLVASGMITVPGMVTIREGDTTIPFDFTVRGTGGISASSAGLTGDSEEITMTRHDVKVKLAVAPNVILPGGTAQYFIWLERDEMPYNPPHAIRGELQTSDTGVIRFSEGRPAIHQAQTGIVLRDGMARGVLYAGGGESHRYGPSPDDNITLYADLHVMIPGYGHAESGVIVGTALLKAGNHKLHRNGTAATPGDTIEAGAPNRILFWVYPNHTGGTAYATVGFYRGTGVTETIPEYYTNGTTIERHVEYERLVPARAEHLAFYIAGDRSMLYEPNHVIIPSRHTNAATFPITAYREGSYEIVAAGAGSTDTAGLVVAAPHETKYRVQARNLPAIPDTLQPLYMVTITDDTGTILDVYEEFSGPRTIRAAFSDDTIQYATLGPANTGLMYGMIRGQTGTVMTLEGAPGAQAPVLDDIIPAGAPVSIELDAPRTVHTGEGFPVAIHRVDSSGIPVYRVSPEDIEASGFDIRDGLAVIHDTGSVLFGVISRAGGAVQAQAESFLNNLNLEAEVPGIVPAGLPFLVRASSPVQDVSYTLESPWPYHTLGNGTFEVTPGGNGTADLMIRASMEGFAPDNLTVRVSSQMSIPLDIDATSLAGERLAIQYTMNGSLYTTPYSTILYDPQRLKFEFPEYLSLGNSGYGLVGTEYTGARLTGPDTIEILADDSRTIVTALYERQIQIFVTGGSGGGIYPHGTPVTVSAEPGVIVPYVIPERFVRWEGAPGEPESFVMTADRNAQIVAIFEPDYTIMMLLVTGGMAAGVFAYVRNRQVPYALADIIYRRNG